MWNDLRYGLRRLGRQRFFSVAVILLLAVGIGSNAVIFGLVDALLWKPLPVREPENLFLIEQMRKQQVRPDTSFFYRQYEAIEGERKIFSGAVAEQGWAGNSFQALTMGDGVHLISTQMVSPNYFAELGVKAKLGRVLDRADAADFAETPVVMSAQCWSSLFRRDRHILNRVIRIRDAPFRVVGVLPEEFHGVNTDRVPDIRLPISAARLLTGSSVREPGGDYPVRFQILARLRGGLDARAAASALITPLLTQMEEPLWRGWYARSTRPMLVSQLPDDILYWRSYRVALREAGRGVSQLREQFSQAAGLLMAAVGLLLVVVCANVAGLLLAKAGERKREIGIRYSLGASRWRLVRQFYAENGLLAMAGSILGVVFARFVAPWLLSFLPSTGVGAYAPPTVLDVRVDVRLVVFIFVVTMLTVALFAILPVRHAWRHDLNRSGVAAVPVNGVIGFQIGLTALLVTCSLLVLKTFWKLERQNPGFDQEHVIEAVVDPWDAGFSEAQATTLLTAVKARMEEMPGVRAVGFAGSELMRGIGTKTTVTPAGRHFSKETFLNTSLNRVTPEYFESLGIPLIAGRKFGVRDVGVKPARIVVNRAFADNFFPGEDPVGKAIVQGVDGTKTPTAVIVGVVGTAKYRSMREVDPPTYYLAADMAHAGGVMYVRTRGDARRFMRAVSGVFRELAPALPIASIYTLKDEIEASLWQEKLVTLLCGFFGFTALGLSGAGVYSVLGYAVKRRERELGIRMALGAQASDIVQTVTARLVVSVLAGALGGLVASAWLVKVVKGLLFQVDPVDAPSYAGAAFILVVCSGLAAVIPTLRAIRTQPSVALRQE